jgi:hypothetical protein
MTVKKQKRAVSIEDLLSRKFRIMELDGEWKELIGEPEMNGCWLIWANSGNGKTRFCLMLAKYLTKFGKVAYDTLEEGARRSMQKAVSEVNMEGIPKLHRPIFLDREPIDELKVRLKKHKSPDIIFIDSFQYAGLSRTEYIKLKEEFPNKLFIFVSHAEGKNPLGRTAQFVRYDVDVKIRIEGFTAFAVTRYGDSKAMTIWEKGAAEYWNQFNNDHEDRLEKSRGGRKAQTQAL